MCVRVIDEYYKPICVVVIQEISNLIEDSEIYVIINDKKLPFKVINDGGFKVLRKINYIEKEILMPNIEFHGLISNIYNFNELQKLVG